MSNGYLDDAAAAADALTTTWFTVDAPGRWVPDDFWKTPTIAAELGTFMRLAGTQRYLPICDAARDAGSGYLSGCGWLDDADSWGRFGLDVGRWLTAVGSGDADAYLSMATAVCDDLQSTWDDTCGGGLYWKRDPDDPDNFKASNSTLGLAEIALGLNAIRADAERLAWGRRCWSWIVGHRLVDAEGLVWGGLGRQCTILQDNIPVLQLQGQALKPLWCLYEATGDASLLDAAQRIADGALTRFVWPQTSILADAEDAAWSTAAPQWRVDHVNPTLFKGIFIGYLAELAVELASVSGREAVAQRYAAAIRANADAVKASYPDQLYGMPWLSRPADFGPDADATVQACLQYSALAAFDAAATVAPIG